MRIGEADRAGCNRERTGTSIRGAMKTMQSELWYASLPLPALEGVVGGDYAATLRSYRDIGVVMEQPALSEHVIALHEGGPKRIRRWQNGSESVWDVEKDAVSFYPAFRANRWVTEGPIAFTHLTLSAGLLARFAREEFDREPRDLTLLDQVGENDPLIAALMRALADEIGSDRESRLYRESLLVSLVTNVLRRHSTLPAAVRAPVRGGLAGWQLRRVIDYMTQHVARDIGVAELSSLAGLSRAQFFRAFRQSTGRTPGRYLLDIRIAHARELLRQRQSNLESVARAVGFSSAGTFAKAFQRGTGLSPTAFRRQNLERG